MAAVAGAGATNEGRSRSGAVPVAVRAPAAAPGAPEGARGAGGPGGAAPGLVRETLSQPTPLGADAGNAPPRPYVPKSCGACEERAWSIVTWRRDAPEAQTWFCYRCRSWRHAGECARWVSQRDFARIREALRPLHVANLLLVVLTLDPKRAPESLEAQYRVLQPMWQRLQRDLSRGTSSVPGVGEFQYVTTVEMHRSGRPHMNVIIHSRELAQHLRERPPTEGDRKAKRGPKWFRDMAAHAGWGGLAFIGHAKSKDDVASYVTKMEKGEVGSPTLEGEVTKTSQLPIMAPRRMRRVRCSKGFLASATKRKDPDVTGELKQHPTPEAQLAAQRAGYAALASHLGRADAEAPQPQRAPLGGGVGGDAAGGPVGGLRRGVAPAQRDGDARDVQQGLGPAAPLRAERVGGGPRGLRDGAPAADLGARRAAAVPRGGGGDAPPAAQVLPAAGVSAATGRSDKSAAARWAAFLGGG